MAEVKNDLSYTADHEWAQTGDDGVVTVGITDFAQAQLGDVVMVELPEVGDTVDKGDAFGTVESPKSVSDLYAPFSGEIVAINERLEDEPELVNASPYGDGWIVKLKVTGDAEGLLDADAYRAHLEAEDH